MTPEEEAKGQLLFHLENQTGFWFAAVVGDDARPRARLREAAEAFCRAHGIKMWLHAPPPDQLVGLAAELARGAPAGLHWIRTDGPAGLINQWDVATSQLLAAMNERREAYRRRLDGGIVIEGRASLKRRLRELAPDLFSIRAFIAEPGAQAEVGALPVQEWRAPFPSKVALSTLGADPDRELERADRLRGMEGGGARRAWLEAMHLATVGLLRAGRLEEAQRWANHAIRRLDQWSREGLVDGGIPNERAYLCMVQGLTASRHGPPEQALRALDEAIDFFERALQGTDGPEATLWVQALRDMAGEKGRVLLGQGDLAESERWLRRHLELAEAVLRDDPANQERLLDLGAARRDVATLLRAKGDASDAVQLLREAVRLAEQRAAAHPTEDRWQLELLECRRALGDALRAGGDLAAAQEAYNSALRTVEGLAERERDARWHLETWSVLTSLCMVSLVQGELIAALTGAERALSVAERWREQSPGNTMAGWLIAMSHGARAEFLLLQGAIERAEEALLQVWTCATQLPVRRAEVEMATVLAKLHLQVGEALLAEIAEGTEERVHADVRRVAGFLKRAVRLGERCVEAAPDSVAAWQVLDTAYDALCELRRHQGKHRAARRLRRKRRGISRRAHRAGRRPR